MLTFPAITFRPMCSLESSNMLGNCYSLGMYLTGAWQQLAGIQPDLPRLAPSIATTMLPSSFAVTACIIGHMAITRRGKYRYSLLNSMPTLLLSATSMVQFCLSAVIRRP